MGDNPLLSINSLHVHYRSGNVRVRAVDGVSFNVNQGEVVAIVGESGSGKSTIARAIPRILPSYAEIVSGSIIYKGRDLLSIGEDELRKIRGKEIGMIFQEPVSYLNPVIKVGEQIAEALITHQGLSKQDAEREAKNILRYVSVPDADRVYHYYPHQLSGGMAQRVCIGIAISCKPSLLIADEPTSNLDLTVQAQILNLIERLRTELKMAVIIISHDLGVVSGISERVIVLYAGRIVEESKTKNIMRSPRHPYTKLLLASSKLAKESVRIQGSMPDLSNPPTGCRFAPRCMFSFERCKDDPEQFNVEGSKVYCWLYEKDSVDSSLS